MSTISTVAVDFKANTSKFETGLDKVSKSTKKWSDDTKKQTQGAIDAFDGVSKALDRFTRQLISVVAIQRVGAAFVQVAKDVAMLADEAEKVGASLEQFAALDKAAKRNGASIGDVKIAYKELQKSVNEALNGTKDTVQAFKDLGISYNYVSSLTPDKRFLAVADALSRVSDENKRAEIGTKLLGKAYTELAPLIAKGAFGITAAGAGGLSEQQIRSIDSVTKSFEALSRTIDDEFKRSIAALEEPLKVIAKVAEIIILNWGKVLSFFLLLSPTVQKIAGKLVEVLGETFSPKYFAEFTSAGGPILAAFFANIADKFRTIAELGISTFGKLGDAMVIFGTIGETVFTKLTVLVTGLSAAFSSFAAGAIIIIGAFAAAFATGLVAMEAILEASAKLADLINLRRDIVDDLKKGAGFYRQFREDIVAKIAGIDQKGETPEILAQRIKAAQYIIERDANKAGQALDAETERLNALKEKGKELQKELESFSKTVRDDVATSYEVAESKFNKLVQAFDLGAEGMTVETFTRAVAKLVSTLDEMDLERLRAVTGGGPFNVLGQVPAPGIAQTMGFAARSTAAELMGAGTLGAMDSIDKEGKKILAGSLPKGVKMVETEFDKLQEKLMSNGTQLLENSRTATEVYNQQVASINLATQAYIEQGREEEALRLQTIALSEAQRQLQQATSDVWSKTNPEIMKAFEFMSSFADQFSRAIVEGQNFGDALKNVFKSILRDITALILRTAILQTIMNAIGLASPVAATSFGQLTGLIPRAGGGPVMAGRGYLVGETGPEAFVPSTNGYIVPNDMAPSETVVVNQTINIETGVSQTVRAEMFGLLPRFKQEAMAGVLDAKQRGGSYAKGLAAA